MGKWYDTGFQDAKDGFCDPPWQKGHRDHTAYMEGQVDGERATEQDHDHDCGQCEGTGTIEGGLSGDGKDEECPVCDGSGALPD